MNKLRILLFAVFAVCCVAADNENGYQYDYQDDDVINELDEYDDTNQEGINFDDETLNFDEQPLPEPGLVDSPNRDEMFQEDHVIENDLVQQNQKYPLRDDIDLTNDDDADKEVLDEINEFRKNIEDGDQNVDPNHRSFDYYQFEDNRSKQNNEDFEGNDEFEEAIPVDNAQDAVVDDDDQKVFDETKAILKEDNNAEDEFETDIENVDSLVADTNDENEEDIPFNDNAQVESFDENDQNILEETKALLNEDDNNNNNNNNNNDQFDDDIIEKVNNNVDTAENKQIEPELSFEQLDEILDKIDENSNPSIEDSNFDLNQEKELQNPQQFDEEGIINKSNENVEENERLEDFDDTQAILNEDTNEDEQVEDIIPSDNEQQIDDEVGRFFNSVFDTNDDSANDQSSDESEQIDDTNDNSHLASEEQNNIQFEEQQQNIETNDNDDDEGWKENQEQNNSPEVNAFDNSDELDEYDSDKILEDLDGDLKSLFATWDKLNQPDSEENQDEVQKYESENGRPFGEKYILSQREDQELAPVDSQEETLDLNDSEQVNIKEESQKSENEKQDEDWERSMEDNVAQQNNIEKPVIYSNDGIVDDQINNDKQQETKEKSQETKTIQVENLTNSQYDDLMKQFAIVYHDDLHLQAKGFGREVAAIHMNLSVDEPTVVTSPNYPNAYPTNNIVDWIFDGEGTGIELNVSDLALNGVLGDYLLVKPGGEDETGTDGLLFSYTLREPRNYRFFDVDKLFVRFEAKLGLAFSRGFQFSVKMINPLPEDPEPEPEPAPLLPTPSSTLTVSLGGISAQEFLNVKEDFRQLIADMATMYINANYIELGANTTSEITQITNVAICNVNWPGFESCVQASFGVPLVYQDDRPARLHSDDLHHMWTTYITADPFAQRLRRMGIEEFAVPNDNRIVMVWLVIGAGVLISAAMLALALWRFSCFEDYTRMPAFSDSDSIMNEKRGLDLYPTPHQNLPPLYGDSDSKDFKWEENFGDSTRVDMGGYANRSFTRDELYDIESDEDNMMTTRDRTSKTPKDIYKV